MMRAPVIVFGLMGLVAALAALGPAGARDEKRANPPMSDLTLDHVLVGIADLEAGIRQLTALTGVTLVRGGSHPGRGTQNALLSLGPHTYLELIAPVKDAALQGPMRQLAQLHQPTPIAWAVGTHRLEAASERLRAAGLRVSAPQPGSRIRPDGRRLEWRTAEIELASDLKPFLIEWSPATTHPAADSPAGCALDALAIRGPAAAIDPLRPLVAELGPAVSIAASATLDLRLTLHCPTGLVTLPAGARATSPAAR